MRFGILVGLCALFGCGLDPGSSRQPLELPCPALTRAEGGKCVLDGDVELDAPLMLESGTHLNCKGHALLPRSVGVDGPLGVYQPSVPEVAVGLVGTREVKVQNCVIGTTERRIDFGVVILASKSARPDGNKILGNQIHARAGGIKVLGSDGNVFSDNLIEWDGSGVGINIGRDSDRNQTLYNTVSSSARAPGYVRDSPGNDLANGIPDVGIIHADPVTVLLWNVIIDGRLLQFTNIGAPRVEDNLCEGNTVSLPGPHAGKNHGGIIAAVMSSRTIIRGNTVSGGRPGIRNAGFSATQAVQFPERCSGDPERFCVSDADCRLGGVDLGTCPPLAPAVALDARAKHTVNEGNTLFGPFGNPGGTDVLDAAMGPYGSTLGAVVRDNRVYAAGSSFGISVQGEGIRDSVGLQPGSGVTITRNLVDGAQVGLNLRQGAATFFGANVSRNDIINSVGRAVSATGAWTIAAELSVDGVGNYWGHSVAPGFLAGDSNSALIADHNPFCQPVAELADPLPAICP